MTQLSTCTCIYTRLPSMCVYCKCTLSIQLLFTTVLVCHTTFRYDLILSWYLFALFNICALHFLHTTMSMIYMYIQIMCAFTLYMYICPLHWDQPHPPDHARQGGAVSWRGLLTLAECNQEPESEECSSDS